MSAVTCFKFPGQFLLSSWQSLHLAVFDCAFHRTCSYFKTTKVITDGATFTITEGGAGALTLAAFGGATCASATLALPDNGGAGCAKGTYSDANPSVCGGSCA